MDIKHIVKQLGKTIFWLSAGYFSMILLLLIMFRWMPIPTSSFMLQQNLSAWKHNDATRKVRYEWLAWEDLPKTAALAVIAAEDQRFLQHNGLDFNAIRAALKSSHKQRRGASTITQQVVKNLFLWSHRSYFRKGLEASISLLMELVWSKQRILEVYLNIAQFSQRDYGIKAATRYLLKKKSSHLSLSKAALLAAVLPAPRHYSVRHPSRKTQKKQRWIQRQMRQLGGLTHLKKL